MMRLLGSKGTETVFSRLGQEGELDLDNNVGHKLKDGRGHPLCRCFSFSF